MEEREGGLSSEVDWEAEKATGGPLCRGEGKVPRLILSSRALPLGLDGDDGCGFGEVTSLVGACELMESCFWGAWLVVTDRMEGSETAPA